MVVLNKVGDIVDVIIVGAGPAGLMAGILACRGKNKVTILERNERPGKKLLATGNGRCNYTNKNISIDRYHGTNKKFAYSALSKFSFEDAKNFFEELGMQTTCLTKGRAYPRSLQASSVLDLLLMEFRNLGGRIAYEQTVLSVEKKDVFIIETENNTYKSDKLILANGGMTLKTTGSDGNGYDLAKSFGHKITDLGPAIVQIKLKGKDFKAISGTRFNGLVKLYKDDEFVHQDEDEILFTDYGISGPSILQLSRRALDIVNDGSRAYFYIDLFPEYPAEKLIEKFAYEFAMSKNTLKESFVGKINDNLIPYVLKDFDCKQKVNSIDYKEIEKIVWSLKNWIFEVDTYKSIDGAQVTVGGVDTSEINPSNMESKLVEDLYFVGEIVDIDGDCGGFNLHWAWASANACGSSI